MTAASSCIAYLARIRAVIILLQPDVTEEQIQHVIERIEGLGMKAHLSRGTYRTIIGVIGDETKLRADAAGGDSRRRPGRGDVEPFKLASREAHPEPSVVTVGGVKIGGGIWE